MGTRTILFSLLFVLSGHTMFASCIEHIKDFYIQYMTCIEMGCDESEIKHLKEAYLTKNLIKKQIPEMIARTDADPIIRAQDVNETCIETLTVEDLGNHWYRVSYYWKKGDASTLTQIPVRATGDGDNCKICHITPEWEEEEALSDEEKCTEEKSCL